MEASEREAVDRLANSLGSERNVVERIRQELGQREWSQAELVRRMKAAADDTTGGVITTAVLSKLLNPPKGADRRHVSIDQLVTLAKVFECSISALLLPPSAYDTAETLEALSKGAEVQRRADMARWELEKAQARVVRAMLNEPGVWVETVANMAEDTVNDVKRQGRELGDSFRAGFLLEVLKQYGNQRKAE